MVGVVLHSTVSATSGMLFPETLHSRHCIFSPNHLRGSRTETRRSLTPLFLSFRTLTATCSRVGSEQLVFEENVFNESAGAVADRHDLEKPSKDEGGLEISKLGISQVIVSSLAKRGISRLFPIQQAVLEPLMNGRDMIGRAKTGTGKTLAFAIPIMNKLIELNTMRGKGKNPLALILAPTRELSRQVDKEFHDSAPNLDSLCVYGGVPIMSQMSRLNYGVDVVVGTPGRVIDLVERGSLNLSEILFAVLDEADQMLNISFQEDVEMIFSRLPEKRQSMMFSATMPPWIRSLGIKYLKDPLTVDLVGDSDLSMPEGIALYTILADPFTKSSIIPTLINEHAKNGKCIVFTQTKRDADTLAYSMQRKLSCQALHGNITQARRESALFAFRSGEFKVLVATDVASRGLDIPNVDLVIQYELPNSPEIFVHRTGRTGRAGKEGCSILIHTEEQRRDVSNIEREVGCRFMVLPRIAAESGDGGGFYSEPGSFGARYSPTGSSRAMGDSVYQRSAGDSGYQRYSSGGPGGSGYQRSGPYSPGGSAGGSGYQRSGPYLPGGSSGGSGYQRSGPYSPGGSAGDSVYQRSGRYSAGDSGYSRQQPGRYNRSGGYGRGGGGDDGKWNRRQYGSGRSRSFSDYDDDGDDDDDGMDDLGDDEDGDY